MERTQVVELTVENFDEAVPSAQQPVLVDFWTPWCAPCRAMAPVVDTLAEVFAERLKVGKVNVDRHPELAANYGVMSIPTLALIQGGKLLKTWAGVQPQASLVRELVSLVPQETTHS